MHHQIIGRSTSRIISVLVAWCVGQRDNDSSPGDFSEGARACQRLDQVQSRGHLIISGCSLVLRVSKALDENGTLLFRLLCRPLDVANKVGKARTGLSAKFAALRHGMRGCEKETRCHTYQRHHVSPVPPHN